MLEDHGKGIPDIETAMQEGFSTASQEARNLGFGAGMGLPNMKKYTDTMQIESTVGVGSHCAHDRSAVTERPEGGTDQRWNHFFTQ